MCLICMAIAILNGADVFLCSKHAIGSTFTVWCCFVPAGQLDCCCCVGVLPFWASLAEQRTGGVWTNRTSSTTWQVFDVAAGFVRDSSVKQRPLVKVCAMTGGAHGIPDCCLLQHCIVSWGVATTSTRKLA
jgi:hypothetical protein